MLETNVNIDALYPCNLCGKYVYTFSSLVIAVLVAYLELDLKLGDYKVEV